MGSQYHQKCLFKRLDTHRGGGDVKIEAEIRVLQPQTKEHQECWQSPEARKGKELILLWSLCRECDPADTLISDFWPPEL